jgi:hypothetical protein
MLGGHLRVGGYAQEFKEMSATISGIIPRNLGLAFMTTRHSTASAAQGVCGVMAPLVSTCIYPSCVLVAIPYCTLLSLHTLHRFDQQERFQSPYQSGIIDPVNNRDIRPKGC